MKKKLKFLSTILCFLLIFSFSGCGSSNKKSNNTSDKKQGTESKESKNLKIVTTDEGYKTLFDKFTKETGVKVEFTSASSGEVLSKVKAEGKNPTSDVWFGGGIDAFMQAKEEGLLEKYDFNEAKDIETNYKDKDNYWFSKGLTVVGFIVNNDVLKEKKLEAPKTWDDLASPNYKDQIIMSNPAISGTNYAVVNCLLQNKGEENGWKYFTALNKNIPFYTKRGKDPNVKTSAGEFAIGITYIDKALENLEKEKNVKIIYPEDGIPWMPDGVAIFKNSKNMDSAKKFISWVFKDENLVELAKIDKKDTVKIIKPNLKGIDLTFPKDKLLKEDLSLFGKNREAVLNKWKQMVENKK